MPDPLRLADLDPARITSDILNVVLARAYRDTRGLGLVIRVEDPCQDEKSASTAAVEGSEVFRAAQALAEWATSGRGQAAEIPALLRQVRADLEGIDAKIASTRGPVDLATLAGVALVAAGARLALGAPVKHSSLRRSNPPPPGVSESKGQGRRPAEVRSSVPDAVGYRNGTARRLPASSGAPSHLPRADSAPEYGDAGGVASALYPANPACAYAVDFAATR